MQPATICIIIPAYNQGRFLGEAIQSVLDQTVQDLEIIVVDDGSTDQTQEIVRSFFDPRIRYIFQQNRGLSGARNTGIRNTHAHHLLFLDADDRLFPQALEFHLNNLRDHPETGLSVGGWELINDQGPQSTRQVVPPASIPLESMLFSNPFPVHSVLVTREWFDRCGLFDEGLNACEDWDLWLRFAMAGCSITTFDKIVCMYRMHPNQMTKQPGRMRTAMLEMLDKTFTNPALPTGWQGLRDKANASALVKAAARGYFAGQISQASHDLSRAIQLDPDMLADDAAALANLLAGWADAPMVTDPFAFLERIYHNLPAELSFLRRRRLAHLANMALDMAYRQFKANDPARGRHFLLRALRYQPGLLLERGISVTLLRSYLPSTAART